MCNTPPAGSACLIHSVAIALAQAAELETLQDLPLIPALMATGSSIGQLVVSLFPAISSQNITHHLYDNVAAPPALGSVILADDGAAIYVTFDEPTNRANYYGLFPCSVLVANASILGSNPVCYWQNSLVLVIRLGRDASFAIGEDLTFLPYLIASAGSNDTQNDSNFLTAPISPAINPNSPVVGIEGIF